LHSAATLSYTPGNSIGYEESYSVSIKKVKVKIDPRAGHEGPEGEYRYSSTLSLISALNEVGGEGHPSRFTSWKDSVPIV
jgi:hypothetical protein